MGRTIVFINGAWVTSRCWDQMLPWFAERGYTCLAPDWPGKDRPIEAIRADPSPLAGLGTTAIVDHYDRIIRALPEPPILVGHSFGGLFVQLLLDRGLGAAGVAIDPAPPKGVFAYEPTTIRALLSVLLTPFAWSRVVRWTFGQFRYAFVLPLSPEAQREAFETQVIPETGRIFIEGAVAPVSPRSPARISFANKGRAPLLLIAGSADRIVPAVTIRRTVRAYERAGAPVSFLEFAGRSHWIIAQDGWQEVAGAIDGWLQERLV